MIVKDDKYSVDYDAMTATIYLRGVLRLNTEEYAPIVQLLEQIITQNPSQLTINLRELEFLNSSGFTNLARFITKVNTKKTIQLKMQASSQNPWHQKSLNNFKRLMPQLQLEFI
jgi:hypothetical protein